MPLLEKLALNMCDSMFLGNLPDRVSDRAVLVLNYFEDSKVDLVSLFSSFVHGGWGMGETIGCGMGPW